MICPVSIVDHESSLIAADWYEENGLQEYADGIRHKPNITTSLKYDERVLSNNQSSYGSEKIDSWHISFCQSRAGDQQPSYSKGQRMHNKCIKSTCMSSSGRRYF